MSIHLSPEDVREITGYTYTKYQAKELARLGIPFTINRKRQILIKSKDYLGESTAELEQPRFDGLD